MSIPSTPPSVLALLLALAPVSCTKNSADSTPPEAGEGGKPPRHGHHGPGGERPEHGPPGEEMAAPEGAGAEETETTDDADAS